MATAVRIGVTPVDTDGADAGPEYVVNIDMRGIMAWETMFVDRSFTELTTKAALSAHDMYELGYVGAKRAGKVDGTTSFSQFVEANVVRVVPAAETVAAPEPAASSVDTPAPAQPDTSSGVSDGADPPQPGQSTEV